MLRPAVGAASLVAALLLPAACTGGGPEAVAPSTLATSTTGPDVRLAEFCAVVDALDNADPFAAVEAATTPAAAAAAFEAGVEAISPLADDPPDEIADAANAYVGGFAKFGDLLRAAEYNASRVDEDVLAAISAEVAVATSEIEAYAAANC